MQPAYISSELFHFVGRSSPEDHEQNYSNLKMVLAAGCVSHPPHEANWGKISYSLDLSKRMAREEMLVPTVTCYCDIPYGQLAPHISKYGAFGLSFSRHHLTKFGARPVIYVPCRPDDWRGVFTGHSLLKELETTFQGIREHQEALSEESGKETSSIPLGARPATLLEALAKAEHTLGLRILAFVKPYESTLEDADPRYYYSEREWRKLGNLMFSSDEVLRVVVHRSFLERALEELPQFQGQLTAAPCDG